MREIEYMDVVVDFTEFLQKTLHALIEKLVKLIPENIFTNFSENFWHSYQKAYLFKSFECDEADLIPAGVVDLMALMIPLPAAVITRDNEPLRRFFLLFDFRLLSLGPAAP